MSFSPPIAGLADALAFCRAAHAGQVDKAGRPYAEHPERVAARAMRIIDAVPPSVVGGREGIEILRAALLHDVVEDAAVTLDDLRAR